VTSAAAITVCVAGENTLVDNIVPYDATSVVDDDTQPSSQFGKHHTSNEKRTCFVLRGATGDIICRRTDNDTHTISRELEDIVNASVDG
jgi:hypothetical protein